MIDKIERIISRHGSVQEAVEDYEGQMAILMGIAQIGEALKKLSDNVIQEFDLTKDKEGAYYTRNYIVHDYEGVDLSIIESIIKDYLPKLKSKLSKN